ncbi:MAG TPA: AAA family ATPase [Actinomycetota bacterium]|nr:AAA family ATPase [Actinomycetota bacterium]
MTRLKIWLFGPPRIELDGTPVEVDTRKAVALLAYLTITGRPHGRDALAALLWPDLNQDRARAALRRTLSTLRKGLGGSGLAAGRSRVSLEFKDMWLDTARFLELIGAARAHDHLATDVCRRCISDLSEAAELSRGDFMSGFFLRDSPEFEDWMFFQSEELRRDVGEALERLVTALIGAGEPGSAVDVARRWLQLDSLHEPAHRALMRLYAWKGLRSKALSQYRECVLVLDRELGVPPLEETAALYRAIESGQLEPPAPAPQPPPEPPGPPASSRIERLLVGREGELGELLQAFVDASRQGRFVVVEGEAGVGKSSLVEAALDRLREQGAEILSARCYPGEQALALAPISQLLRTALKHDQAWAMDLPTRWAQEAARLVPELAELRSEAAPPPTARDEPGGRIRLYEGVAAALDAACCSGGPGAIFVDDLHWADDASLDFLSYLLHRLRERLLLVLTAWRREEVPPGHRLALMLSEATLTGSGSSIPLQRLGRADIAELVTVLAPDATGDLVNRLYAETDGLPFFVMEYLAALPESDGGEQWPLPRGIRDLLHARLAPLSQVGRQLLGAAAVIGGSFELDSVRTVSGRSEDEAVGALEEVIERGFVVEQRASDSDPLYDFSHDKVRELIYEETSAARRRLLHARVADALAGGVRRGTGSGRPGVVARHYQAAGNLAEAAEWYLRAGDEARNLYANGEALSHYGAALAYGHPQIGDLHEAMGDLHTLAGEYRRALDSYEAAAAHPSSTVHPSSSHHPSSSRLPRIEHKIGNVHHRTGKWDLADSHYEAALSSGPEEALSARITADQSLTAHRRGDDPHAVELGREALRLAEAAEDLIALAQAHNILGMVAGGGADAVAELERSLAYAEAAADPAARVAALNNLALAHRVAGDAAHARELTEQALALCATLGDRHREAALRNNLADLLHGLGRHEEAMEELKRAVALFAEIGEPGELQPAIWRLIDW